MKRSLVVLFLVAFVTGSQLDNTLPSFFWSNVNYFTSVNEQALFSATSNDVAFTLTSRLRTQENPLSRFVIEGELPELIVIYVAPHLQTHELSQFGQTFKNLKAAVTTSTSSFSAPYCLTGVNKFGDDVVSQVMESLPKSASVFLVHDEATKVASIEGAKTLSMEELEKALNSDWSILRNGVPDVLVVYFSQTFEGQEERKAQFAEDDRIIGRINAAVQTTSFVSLFTTNNVEFQISRSLPVTNEKLADFEYRFRQKEESTNWPEGVIAGLYVALIFIVILFMGICALSSIQTGIKFEAMEKFQTTVSAANQ